MHPSNVKSRYAADHVQFNISICKLAHIWRLLFYSDVPNFIKIFWFEMRIMGYNSQRQIMRPINIALVTETPELPNSVHAVSHTISYADLGNFTAYDPQGVTYIYTLYIVQISCQYFHYLLLMFTRILQHETPSATGLTDLVIKLFLMICSHSSPKPLCFCFCTTIAVAACLLYELQ